MENFKDILGTKPIHPFPARMAPSIVWNNLPDAKNGRLRILDPMSGSGTVAVVSRFRGHSAFGFDADPLAVLLARTWCTSVDYDDARTASERVFRNAVSRFSVLPASYCYPAAADDETKAFINYWFDPINRAQLTCLAASINEEKNDFLRDVLWCSFSRLIIAKKRGVSLAMDLSHSRPHRTCDTAPIAAFDHFSTSVEHVVRNIPFCNSHAAPAARIVEGDARAIKIKDLTIDKVITSPPYSNAIDYIRCSKFSLVWMGHSIRSLRGVRADSIGTESCGGQKDSALISEIVNAMGDIKRLPTKNQKILGKYIADMDRVISESARVLRYNGEAIFVLGNSSIKNVFVSNSSAIKALGTVHGLRLVEEYERPLPTARRYLPPPCNDASGENMQTRMRTEVVLKLKKAA